MRRFLPLLLFLFLTAPLSAQFSSIKNATTKNKLAVRYSDYLSSKGYEPEIDEDGDIKFTFKEKTFYVTLDKNDEKFFRIARIANLSLESESKINRAKIISHDLTKDKKVAKVYWSNGQIWASSEQLLADTDDFKKIFDRTLRLTEDIYNQFVKEWNKK